MSNDDRYNQNAMYAAQQSAAARSAQSLGLAQMGRMQQFEPRIRTVADALAALQARRDELAIVISEHQNARDLLDEKIAAARDEIDRIVAMVEAGILKAEAEAKE